MTRNLLILISAAAIPLFPPAVRRTPCRESHGQGSSGSHREEPGLPPCPVEDSAAAAGETHRGETRTRPCAFGRDDQQVMEDEVYSTSTVPNLRKAPANFTEVGMLIKEPRFVITVGGHTDARGTEDYTWSRQQARPEVQGIPSLNTAKADRLETISAMARNIKGRRPDGRGLCPEPPREFPNGQRGARSNAGLNFRRFIILFVKTASAGECYEIVLLDCLCRVRRLPGCSSITMVRTKK